MKLTKKTALAAGALLVAVPILAPHGVALATPPTVKGKVVNTSDLLNPVWNEAKLAQSHRYTFREPSSSVPTDARILRGHLSKELCVAVLSEGPAKAGKAIPIRVEGGRTSQVTLVVAPGQEITFTNMDPTEHVLYEVNGKMTKSTIAIGGTTTWTPPGPGKYELRDELSPSLRSWIVVEPRTYRVRYPARSGALDIPEIEPGSYTLQAYYNGEKVGEELPLKVEDKPAEQPMKESLKAGPDKSPQNKGADDKKDPKDPKKEPPKAPEPPKGGG